MPDHAPDPVFHVAPDHAAGIDSTPPPPAGPQPTRIAADPRIPALSLVFGYGPTLLILLLGLGGWLLPPIPQSFAVAGGWLWATAILLFLAGVTRGLSFFSPGGPRSVQIGFMLWLFLLGFGALTTPLWIAFALLILGYGSIAVYDPQAAHRGLAPAHFARLRPSQMGVAVVGLALLMVRALHG